MDELLAWLREQLARYTYRPGWSLTIEPDFTLMAAARFVVAYQAPDSRDPARTIPLQVAGLVSFSITDTRDEDLFARWLQDALLEVERHESREWLRRDGKIYDDPHGGDARS